MHYVFVYLLMPCASRMQETCRSIDMREIDDYKSYIANPGKKPPKLWEYAQSLRLGKAAKDLIGVWL